MNILHGCFSICIFLQILMLSVSSRTVNKVLTLKAVAGARMRGGQSRQLHRESYHISWAAITQLSASGSPLSPATHLLLLHLSCPHQFTVGPFLARSSSPVSFIFCVCVHTFSGSSNALFLHVMPIFHRPFMDPFTITQYLSYNVLLVSMQRCFLLSIDFDLDSLLTMLFSLPSDMIIVQFYI